MNVGKAPAYASNIATVMYRLALPISVVVAGYLVYLGMTRPYDDCVYGASQTYQTVDGAKAWCYGKR